MGKDEKEETGFGFKDRAKAEETIVLLADKEVSYQRLTVRGLLGRAKRVLSLTKADEKIKNIKEAMSVFEEWLEKYSKEHPPKKASESKLPANEDEDMETDDNKEKKKSPSAETVPGLGFKDKSKAEETIKLLKGRDPDYQRLAVKGLVQRAKRVLTCTNDKDKIQNIKEALGVFDSFLETFDRLHLSRQNNAYLPLSVVLGCATAGEETLSAFTLAYRAVGGDYKRLRCVTVPDRDREELTWDIVRNDALKELKEKYKDAKLFDSEGKPTKEHLEMILWAYSPDEEKTKKLKFPKKEDETEENTKDEEEEDKIKRKINQEKKFMKRKSSSGDRSLSSDSSEESPKKKRKT